MPEPIPILFTIPNFLTAGSGRAMLNIARRLDPERFVPTICVSQRGGALDAEVQNLGMPLLESQFTVPARPRTTVLGSTWRAASTFRAHGFRLWHSFHYLDDYTEPLVARMAGARWIFTKKNMNWNRRSWLLRSALASRVVAQNQSMMRDFFSGPLLRSRVRLIPRGVDTAVFSPNVTSIPRIRSRLSIPDNVVVAVCVAHLLPVKGHLTLLRALQQVDRLQVIVAGAPLDPEHADNLRQTARDLEVVDRVHFVGEMSDVPGLLAEADIFVLPTWNRWRVEGCPVALLEGMAAGKACVATRVAGSMDLIEDGVSGMLVKPENTDELASALQLLVDSPELRIKLGSRARQRAVDRYSIEREVEAHERLYLELVP